MRVDIRGGGDGVACWNADAVRAFAGRATQREEQLAGANPDLVLTTGQVKCYGCEVMDHGYGTRCTAVLTHTLYSVAGEIEPRAADAGGSLLEIPGLVSKIDTPPEVADPPHAASPATPEPAPSVRGGLRRLIGR